MNTYSHVIVTAVLSRTLHNKVDDEGQLPNVRTGALLIGSFIPDALLILITIGAIAYDRLSGVTFANNPEAFFNESTVGRLFNDWYFNNPWVIGAQNLFHSPLLVLIYIGVSYWLWRRYGYRWAAWFFWLSIGAMLHTLVDIPLHYDDGPLLFFPLNWTLRFQSPVSYWDPARYGQQWSIFEHTLDLVLLIVLLTRYRQHIANWFRRRMQFLKLTKGKAD